MSTWCENFEQSSKNLRLNTSGLVVVLS